MNNEELLIAIFDIIDQKLDEKLDDFQLDMKVSERNINRNIHKPQVEMDIVIEVLKLHELVLARINKIRENTIIPVQFSKYL